MDASVDLCVVGGGEAGFSAALAGAALGLRVVLATASNEDPRRCNWDVALSVLRDAALGARRDPEMASAFSARLELAMTAAAPDRRFARLRAMNVRVVTCRARFVSPTVIEIAGETVRARRFVIATGARPDEETAPDTSALDSLRRFGLPTRALILGGDARSVALAQGLGRLGVDVRLQVPPEGLLATVDPELVQPLRAALLTDGIGFDLPGGTAAPPVFHAAATRPLLSGLALEHAEVAVKDGHLALSPALRTTNRRIYAIGGAAGAASSQAVQAQLAAVIRSAFFRLPTRFDPHMVPSVVPTDPEIASIGLSEAEASSARPVTVLRWPLAETARGAAERTPGHVKVVADKRGRVLGAGIAGPGAADGIAFWTLAVRSGATLQQLADIALPCPSFGEASRRLIVQHAASRLRSPLVKRALTLLGRLG